MSNDLKTQFLNQMTLQRFSHHTKNNYLTPDTLTNDQIQEYLRYLLEDRKLAWGTCNNYFSGIIFFYIHLHPPGVWYPCVHRISKQDKKHQRG